MKKEDSGLTNNNCKKVTKASLRRWHEPRPSEEKLLQGFSHKGTASAEILMKELSLVIQGTERESLCLQLAKIKEGKVIDEVEEIGVKQSYEYSKNEFILGILVNDKLNS